MIKALFIAAALLISAPALSQRDCLSVEALREQALQEPDRVFNFRRLDDVAVERANEIVAVAPEIPPEDWTLFILVDRIDGGGFLFMGHDDAVCYYISYNSAHWFMIKRELEGVGV